MESYVFPKVNFILYINQKVVILLRSTKTHTMELIIYFTLTFITGFAFGFAALVLLLFPD